MLLLNSQSIAISLGIAAHATILWLSVLSEPPPSMSPPAPLNRGRGWMGCGGNARAARSSAMEIISAPFETPGGGLLDFQELFWPLLQKPGRKPFLGLNI